MGILPRGFLRLDSLQAGLHPSALMKPLIFPIQAAGFDTLPLYYALQAAGMPCVVIAVLGTLKVTPEDPRNGKHPESPFKLTAIEQRMRIDGFVRGWLACVNQTPLDPDKPLGVSRVPKPNEHKLTAVDPWEA